MRRGKKRIRGFLLLVVWIILCLGIALWVLVTQPFFSRPRGLAAPPVDSQRLRHHVQILSETFRPRDGEHPQVLDEVADYIAAEFRQAGGRVSDQDFEVAGRNYRNVVAQWGPEGGERIVVGAHYDTAGDQPGADDNASAVAGLIELVRLLGRRTLPVTLEAVAFSLEEPPYFGTSWMGSAVHARSLRERGVLVRAMICLEMIGYFSDAPGSQGYPLPLMKACYPKEGNFIAVVGKAGQPALARRVKAAMRATSPLPVFSINAPAMIPGIDLSDHLNYWAQGYEAVMITDTAFYRNPNYHEVTDTWDTLDYNRLALVVQGLFGAVLSLMGDSGK
jgi:hypothetical protein